MKNEQPITTCICGKECTPENEKKMQEEFQEFLKTKKTMTKEAKEICTNLGFYVNGECPLCGDYIKANGDCMYCDFHSNLIPKK